MYLCKWVTKLSCFACVKLLWNGTLSPINQIHFVFFTQHAFYKHPRLVRSRWQRQYSVIFSRLNSHFLHITAGTGANEEGRNFNVVEYIIKGQCLDWAIAFSWGDPNWGKITKVRKECPSVSVSDIYFFAPNRPFKEKGSKLLFPTLNGTFITYRCFPACHWMAWQIAKVWIWWISVCWWICHSSSEGGKARFVNVIDCPLAHPNPSLLSSTAAAAQYLYRPGSSAL